MNSSQKKGFTLIELLVVIAIIALLLSIIMPALRKSKMLAFAVICRSNLHQWSVTAKLYTDDNNDTFQGGWGGNAFDSNWWQDAWREYYTDIDEIRCCPYATKPIDNLDGSAGPGYNYTPQTAWGIDNGTFLNYGDYGSYGINGWTESPTDEMCSVTGRPPEEHFRKSTVPGGSQIPLLLDAKWIDMWPTETHRPPSHQDQHWWDEASHFNRTCTNRHDENDNIAFLDLSVRKIGLKQFWTLRWRKTFNTAGTWTLAGGVSKLSWPDWMRDFKDY